METLSRQVATLFENFHPLSHHYHSQAQQQGSRPFAKHDNPPDPGHLEAYDFRGKRSKLSVLGYKFVVCVSDSLANRKASPI